jgi:nucleoside transporter
MATSPASSSPAAPPAAAPLSVGLNVRLSVMMFLQYAIWGAWLPLLYQFLRFHRGFENGQIGYIFAVGAVGAIFAPFVAGQIADRYFPTQWFLGVSHLLGAGLMWQLSKLTEYSEFLWFSLAYSFVFSPTLALTNSLAFHHLPDRDRDFGRVRVWGTVGWIAAGVGVAQWLFFKYTPEEARNNTEALLAAQRAGMSSSFMVSAILGIVMGVYCFFLPNTPAQRGKQAFATLEARSEVQRNPRLLALFLFAVVISCVHQFYFVHTAGFLSPYQTIGETPQAGDNLIKVVNRVFGVGGGGLMAIGQVSELVVLALMPLLARRFSRKTLLTVGIIAYAVRMALFAYVGQIEQQLGIPPIVTLIAGISMHGLCFGCFIFVAFMIVDEETTADVRASAQSLFNLVIIGFGIIVGSKIATEIADWATIGDEVNYTQLFGAPMWAAVLTLIAFLFLYPGKKASDNPRVSA